MTIGTISSEAFTSPAPVSVNDDQAQSSALSLDALHADVAVPAEIGINYRF